MFILNFYLLYKYSLHLQLRTYSLVLNVVVSETKILLIVKFVPIKNIIQGMPVEID